MVNRLYILIRQRNIVFSPFGKRKSNSWFLLFVLVLALPFQAEAQNKAIDTLVGKIASLQRTASDPFYTAGMISSQRIYLKKKQYKREDDNIFFTGLVVWTLRAQQAKLSDQNKLRVDSICEKAVRNYPLYRNKHGDCSYNFWQPKPGRHFPNDRYFSTRKKFALPDDLDDSVILYLSEAHSDSLSKKLKEKMAFHANGNNGKIIRSTFRRYKHRKAYNTWFGKKMPLEFDLSVQCNALRWVLDNKFDLNEYDRETIRLIEDMVLAGEHIRHAEYVSPQYQNASIVLYHLARLVAVYPEQFPRIRDRVIKDIEKRFERTKVPMEKLLLNTSLARFGLPQKQMASVTAKDFDSFYFFLANMTSNQPNPIKRWMAGSRWTNFYYRSEAYYWTLLLENACMQLSEGK